MMRYALHIYIFLCISGLPGLISAQQDPTFSLYAFNSLTFNPAYAGSNEHLALGLIHRRQWLGIDDAPSSQNLYAHTPLRYDPVGIGAYLNLDRLGAISIFEANTAYAYRMRIGETMKLSLGLSMSIANWRSDWSRLNLEQSGDEAFAVSQNIWLPNFGTGVYLYGKQFYAGIGIPRLVEHDLREEDDAGDPVNARNYRHLFASIGGVFLLGESEIRFRPSLLLKSAGVLSKADNINDARIGAPTALDLGGALFFRELFSCGLAWRSAVQLTDSSDDSADFWVNFALRNGLRIGAAYDVPLSAIGKAGTGSFEMALGYEFDIKISRVASPRYF